jgi:ergothioneine biosynthesis protein EgtB
MQFQTLGRTPIPAASDLPASFPLLDRYRAVRAATLALTAPLSPEDLMVQSCPEASPAKWHLAHTTWFFETFVLREFLSDYLDFHPDFLWLFNSYYNSLGDMPAKSLRASFSRPPLADILAYRTHVDTHIARLLEATPEFPANPEASRRIVLGLHHEQQHQELIATDIKHALFTNPLHPAYLPPAAASATDAIAPPLDWVAFAPGLTQIGFPPTKFPPTKDCHPPTKDCHPERSVQREVEGPAVPPHPAELWADFSFDNESPRHTVYLAPFSLATRLVTCAEYLAFMDDNAYNRPELWLSEGWTTLREQGWRAPLYWQPSPETRSGWRIFTLRGWQPLDSDSDSNSDSNDLSETPVCHLSFFEAAAYAQWVSRQHPGTRLPTEFEWEHAAAATTPGAPSFPVSSGRVGSNSPPSPGAPSYPALSDRVGSNSPHTSGAPSFPALSERVGSNNSHTAAVNLLESNHLHPTRASSLPGLQQLYGDVWEWTASAYTGYPGYRPLPGALGEYNGKFMSSQMVLRGGSCVTPSTHIRPTYRNFFPPATRWQFSGLRLARDGS